jgi:hypothetical protein
MMICHQARIRRATARQVRRPRLASLAGCRVEPIGREEARALIEAHEYLGTLGSTSARYGLRAPDGELLGVAAFGRATGTHGLDVCGPEHARQAIVLQRGACVSWAPLHAASYLITRACRLAHRDYGWTIVVAYADPLAGEIGTVYQACSWRYLGQGVGRRQPRQEWRKPGETRWRSSRILHHVGLVGPDSATRARRLGWVSRSRPAKHKYLMTLGPDRDQLAALALKRLGLDAWPRYPRRLAMRENPGRTRRRQQARLGLVCQKCGAALVVFRSHARYCSVRCRVAASRGRPKVLPLASVSAA